MINQRFGSLIVLRKHNSKRSFWVCRCDCGVLCSVYVSHLKRGQTKLCPRCSQQRVNLLNTTHGLSKTRTWRIWFGMRNRCKEGNPRYGGRGIRVCDRWKKFENFFADMGHPPTERHTLDRIRVNGNYTPKNCRWATPRQQANNRSNNRLVRFSGKTMTLSDWAQSLGVRYQTLVTRHQRLGWPIRKILTQPVRQKCTFTV